MDVVLMRMMVPEFYGSAGVLAGWPAGVPRLRSAGGEDAACPVGATPAFHVGVLALLAAHRSRLLTAVLAFIAVHLHILGDVLGSRGPDDYQWPISYLYPFRDEPRLMWHGQWYLNAWPNYALTTLLLATTLVLAWQRGYSIVGLFSRKADQRFIAVLRDRFGTPH